MSGQQRVVQKQRTMLAAFVALAKNQHRPTLAHQIETEESTRIQAFQTRVTKTEKQSAEQLRSDTQDTYRDIAFTSAWYLSVALLLSLLGTLILLILVSVGKFLLGRDVNFAQPFIGRILYGALFSGGVVAALLTLIFIGIIAFIEHADVAISGMAANAFMIVILLVFLFILSASVVRLINVDRDDNR